jgi:hypothetical protein
VDAKTRARVTPRQSENFSPFSPVATMPDYPRPCPRCGVMTAEADFSLDSSKPSGRRSYCKACDRRRGRAYYDAHKDELYAQREAAREAAWQAELEALAGEHKKRVAAQKKLHAAQVRHQKEFLRSIGVPDLGPEEVSERAPRRPPASFPAPALLARLLGGSSETP